MSAVDVLPPSPPATSSGSRKRILPLFASKTSTTTPDDSPASEPEGYSQNSKKKVEFSDLTDILHPLIPGSVLPLSVKLPTASRDGRITIKSILKPTLQDDLQGAGFDGPIDEKLTFIESMESIVQQLAKNDNAEAIDAYQTLSSVIKAYDEMPDEAVLRSKFASISKQIKHHLTRLERPDPQPTDVNLVISALKVIVVLVWNPNLSPLLTDDFRAFILDRAIAVAIEHDAPKSVIVHYLHLLATQNFRPQLLASNSRASRLIEALQGLHGHVKGNGVVSERLLVYQKLLDQARPVMKAKASLWVDHMLSALVSNIPDTRKRALDLARTACQAFPPTSSISGSVRMALDLKQESGKTLGSVICRRLERMISGKDDAIQVPQIWAVVLLLCNNPSMRIDVWQSLKEWLMVLQQCFNGSDAALRQQANSAWNRFVYIGRPYEASDSLVSMLAKPLSAQLNRIINDKSSRASHAVSISSYCNLLYYAFRPASSSAQYNRAWNEYIVKFMRSSFFERTSGNADIASRIFISLFWDAKTSTKIWNENRAHDNRLVEPEELPTIDCKWSRARCTHILEIFQLLFRYSSWGFPSSANQAYVAKAWRHFLKAIQEASSKEIKMSNETRTATISILSFLGQLWQSTDSRASRPETLSLEALTSITRAAVLELGISRILDVSEAEPDALKPEMYGSIFDAIKISQKDEGRPQAWASKYFGIVNHRLKQEYSKEAKSCTEQARTMLDAVGHMLTSTPTAMVEECLKLLSPGLVLWLKDDEARLASERHSPVDESSESNMVSLKRLVSAFSSALARTSSRSIIGLDACLASTLLSSHKTVVNEVVSVWNTRFASQDELQLGPELARAIETLLPYVEIHTPSSWSRHGRAEKFQTAPRYHTQVLDISQAQVEEEIKVADALESSDAATAPIDGEHPDTPQPRQSKWKSRHKYSQLDFVPIPSSSPQGQALESQLMTAHQIEVRDRQQEETIVTFPDLRSSPRPCSRRSESRESGFTKRMSQVDDRPATPVLPDHDGLDGDVQPSPTPKSRVHRTVMDVEVPSSPPSMHDTLDGADVKMEELLSPLQEAVPDNTSAVQVNSLIQYPALELEPQNRDTVAQMSPGSGADGRPETQTHPSVEEQRLEIPVNEAQMPASEAVNVTEAEVAPTNPEDGADNALPSPPSPQQITRVTTPLKSASSYLNTDELNELSASQLGKDLDWSAVLQGLTSPDEQVDSPLQLEPRQNFVLSDPSPLKDLRDDSDAGVNPETQSATDQYRRAQSAPLQKKRRRAQSGYAERKKRRKSNRSASQSLSSQGPSIKEEEPENLYDSVLVDTSSDFGPVSSPFHLSGEFEDQYVTSQQLSDLQIAQGPLRSSESLHLSRQGDPLRRSSRRSSQRLSVPVSPEVELPASQQQRVIPVVEVTLPSSDVAEGQNVLASLQAVLDQVKKAPSRALDLRQIDELCFQIRYYAQAAATSQGLGAAIEG